jgi:hypothetical protein
MPGNEAAVRRYFKRWTTMTNLIEKSKAIAVSIDDAIHRARITSDNRSMIAGGCFDIVLEHQKSITMLAEVRLLGSAFALIRALYESYVSGLWIRYAATDCEIANFLEDQINTSIGGMIARIEKVPGFDVGVLSAIKSTSFPSMCSYTHGGWRQIGRRFNNEYIEPNYSGGEVEEVLNFSNTMALLAAHEVSKMTNNRELVIKVRALFMENT